MIGRPHRFALLTVAAAAILLLAACSSTESNPAPTTLPSSEPVTATSSTTTIADAGATLTPSTTIPGGELSDPAEDPAPSTSAAGDTSTTVPSGTTQPGQATTTTTTTTGTGTSTVPTTSGAGGGTGGGDCSAAGEPEQAAAQPGLSAEVADMRDQIAAAAAGCRLGTLVALAYADGPGFTYSFGEAFDPAGFWQDGEDRGGRPLLFIRGMLDRPFATFENGGETIYVWPSAYSYGDWQSVPAADRAALAPLYDEGALQQFAQAGAYIGYRVGIAADGDWLFFVAGD